MQQIIRGYSPLFTLLTMVPAGVAGVIAAFSSAQILGRTSPAFLMLLSLLAFCLGSCLAGTAPVDVEVLPYISSCIMPFGMDMSFPAATLILSNAVSREHQGVAASLINTVVNYSISLGLGFAGTVEVHVTKGGHTFDDTLHGYRSALYMGIGLAGLGIFLSFIFVLKSYWKDHQDAT